MRIVGCDKMMRPLKMERRKMMICETCNGDGIERCTNPDHGLIDAMSFAEIGRLGCPCCGHDEQNRIFESKCPDCNGTGQKEMEVSDDILWQEIFSLREKLKILVFFIKDIYPEFDEVEFMHDLNSADYDQLMEEAALVAAKGEGTDA